jgi:DNA polymerase III alpha subunit (gram-positive type)
MNKSCPKCGANLIGDGITIAVHCEFAELPADIEPDAGPIYCDYQLDLN